MARYSKQTWDTTSIFNPTRMNHIEQGIYDADLREGGTIGGTLNIENQGADSYLNVGNNKNAGETGKSRSILRLFGKNQYAHWIYNDNVTLTADRHIELPNKAGTIALTDDITFKVLNRNTWAWNTQTYFSIEAISSNTVIVYGVRNGVGFLIICPNNNAELLTIFNNTGCTVAHSFDSSTNKHTIAFANQTSTTGSSVVVNVIG